MAGTEITEGCYFAHSLEGNHLMCGKCFGSNSQIPGRLITKRDRQAAIAARQGNGNYRDDICCHCNVTVV